MYRLRRTKQKGDDVRILNALGCILGLLLLSACASPKVEPVNSVEVRTVEVSKPAPIVPRVDQLNLKPIQWVVITPENIDQKFKEIKDGDIVLFALTQNGYENLATNMSDIRAMIEQQQKIIAIYQKQF